MKIRSVIVCTIAAAALAGAVISGLAFTTFSAADAPAAWLFNIAACVLVFALGFCIKGGTHSLSILLTLLAVCLPAAGPAIAALSGLSIHFMRPARDDEKRFVVGNPVSERGTTTKPGTVLGRPLVESVRRLSQSNLFRLLTGIGSLLPKEARPVLVRLRDQDDAQIQLFAQGGLNDAIEASERHLKALKRRVQSHPLDATAHCSIAEINLYLLDNNLIEEDDRPSVWDAASHAVGDALRAVPNDAQSLKMCARLNLLGGEPEKARLAVESLAKLSGHEETAKLLLAEVIFENGDLESVSDELVGINPGALNRDDILDFWRKPKPAAYV